LGVTDARGTSWEESVTSTTLIGEIKGFQLDRLDVRMDLRVIGRSHRCALLRGRTGA
jgi:hypothetical protein